MSSEQLSVSHFGIYDILTRIVPGAVMLLVFLTLMAIDPAANFSISVNSVIPSSGTDLVMYAIASFLTGEVINIIRIKSHPVPYPFVRLVYEQTNDSEILTTIDKAKSYLNRSIARIFPQMIWDALPKRIKTFLPSVTIGSNVTTKTQHGFWREFKNHFGVNDRFDDIEDIYWLFLSHMEPRMTTQTKRQQTIMHFTTNLFIVLVVSVYFSIWFYFFSSEIGVGFLVTTFIITVLTLYLLLPIFAFLESKFVNKLLIEYYYSRNEDSRYPSPIQG